MIKPITNYNAISKHCSDVILSALVRRRNWKTYKKYSKNYKEVVLFYWYFCLYHI
jgi:hypothetical protein